MSAGATDVYNSEGTLKFGKREFFLDGKPFKILSGAVHYFRTFPVYWRDRLMKLKACGLNTVETYVPWNLHEEYPGKLNFDGMLNVSSFLELAKSLDLYVIFRPGPYICSEWDFGGLPAWLLSDPNMKVRSNYKGYTDAVERYFNKLLPMVVDFQHSNGGPIIAFQIENEFGSYSSDTKHLEFLKNLYIKHGLKELFLTSDNTMGINVDVFYQHALPTANFKDIKDGHQLFNQIKAWSVEFPLMVTEFWTGWFDHWGSPHGGLAVGEYQGYLGEILKANASLNFYMFHGGTNFGFMNGANKDAIYEPDVTSYDYDALLTEKGDITPKYLKTREMLLEHVYKPQGNTSLPDVPENITSSSYASISVQEYCTFETLLNTTKVINSDKPLPMEMLNLHNGYGQNYGLILYRCQISGNATRLEFENAPSDRAQVFLDGTAVPGGVIDWKSNSSAINLPVNTNKTTRRLDILVENHGRVNYGTEASAVLNSERKGIQGNVIVDGQNVNGFQIFPLEFGSDMTNRTDWQKYQENVPLPALFKTTLLIKNTPKDTFIFMKGWGKGIIFVNGFNIGRYWSVGPQQTLYVPAPLLRPGNNEIVFFEQERHGHDIVFTDTPIIDNNDPTKIPL